MLYVHFEKGPEIPFSWDNRYTIKIKQGFKCSMPKDHIGPIDVIVY